MADCDKKLKHLEFIQAVITRMSTDSFMIKGWSVTLVSAIFALAAKDANIKYAVVSYIPVIVFWILDGFFLAQEKQYRKLYEKVSGQDEEDIDFSMKAVEWNTGDRTWRACIFSKTLIPFHGALLAAVLIVMFIIPHLG
jgi:hypothetical protein